MEQTNQFQITPDEQKLREMNRTMEFVPFHCPTPSRLTAEQIEQFNATGFVSPLPVFSPEDVKSQRTYFDGLLARVLEAGGDAYSISSAHLTYGRVYDLLLNPVIVDYVSDLLGPNIIGWGSHYFCKLPGDTKAVDWHQDASYWPLSHTKTVTVWLAIDDADMENGCMQFVEGSHRFGHISHEANEHTQGGVLGRGITDVTQLGTVVDNPLRAGQVSIHSDLLVHGSPPNHSNRRRCGLTLRYCTADVRAGMDWHLKGVVVRGRDAAGHWANPARPQAD